MKKTLLTLAALTLVVGCTHQKVDVNQLGDKDMSCAQIQRELGQLKEMENDIDDKTGFSGRNVGMALLFWPGILVNEMNAGDAEERIADRKNKLLDLHEQKSCS